MTSLELPSRSAETTPFLKVRGRGGLLDGEFVKVALGDAVVLGRSRRCGLSLKKSARYLLVDRGARSEIRRSLAFRSVSRRHCIVAFVGPTTIEIENLSPNGTLVDGRRVATVRLDDIARRTHEIRLGVHGDRFDVELASLLALPDDSVSR